jgi:hypothetical protein
MSRCCILLLVPLLAMGCKCPQPDQAVPARQGDSRVHPLNLRLVAESPADVVELSSLLRFVEDLKGSGHDIYRITRIQFASSSKATMDFLWSGGFHAGELEVTKENLVWTLVHEAYYP